MSIDDLHNRIAKLEKQNRRMKQFGSVLLAVVAVIVIMGQSSARKTVEANEFILRDDGGSIRARLWIPPDSHIPEMVLVNDQGKTTVKLHAGVSLTGGGVIVYNGQGQELGRFRAIDKAASLYVEDSSTPPNSGFLGAGLVHVSDDKGFQATLGHETREASAASLVLSDKNKNVIFKAP